MNIDFSEYPYNYIHFKEKNILGHAIFSKYPLINTYSFDFENSFFRSSNANPTAAGCFGASSGSVTVNSNGGTAPYTYLWNTGDTTDNVLAKTSGEYSVIVAEADVAKAIELLKKLKH